ncbi:HCL396Wp [Eremothecium sinecaudum]|uniref:HCL396Wp n=1 Tax=Eremothecium sinecaudum TaxID=45286 RepID=A0A120K1U3_9SACH|nr:HCL396Wp [Eremothecium sinecaudum]AMD19755.1 HCL396Wp [Eremothecium sinecaudum]
MIADEHNYHDNEVNKDISVHHKIFRAIADVFQSAQSTYAGHRRHIAVLNKIHSKCVDQNLHEAFNYWFNKLVAKILPCKKQDPVGDRISKLVAAFIASNELTLQKQRDEGDLDEKKEQIIGAFVNQLIRFLLRGLESRDKHVRYRSTQLLAVIMDTMGEIEEELYNLVLWSMQKRMYDREPNVRIQAIFCLTKFQDEEQNALEDPATSKLIHAIQNDPSAEVRRAAMLNLVNTKDTINFIVERYRDVNGINRRLVYSKVLKSMGLKVFKIIKPKLLETLIKGGLEDRDETVRQACGKLIAFDWMNLLNGDVIGLLEKLNVTKGEVAQKSLEALFQYRSDLIDKLKFPKEVWQDLNIVTAFLLRTFYEYAIENEMREVIDENFPEAIVLSNCIKRLADQRFGDHGLPSTDIKRLDFIIEQMLHIAYKYDYSDEIGRRDMLNLVRNLLLGKGLSESLIKCSLQVLRILSINERDFITMSVELITDLRYEDIEKQEVEEEARKANRSTGKVVEDGIEAEENAVDSFHSAVENLVNGGSNAADNSSDRAEILEEKQPRTETLLLCLILTRYMLEQVEAPLDQNILISSLMDTLITPAVRNTQSNIRELGVRCLGMCCLLDSQLAIESMYILGMCVSKGNAGLKYIALQVIVDIFSVHGYNVVDGEGKVDSISLHKIFYKILKNSELPECQAIAAEGLCKLFLSDVFTDDDLFETLVLSYFSPANADNEELVQAFAFCLPVYCFSHSNHQSRMARIASDILLRLSVLWDDLQNSTDVDSPSKDSMLKPNAIFQQLIDWTDPFKLVKEDLANAEKLEFQLDFLLDVLKSYNKFERRDVKKMIITNLSKFKITKHHDVIKIKEVVEHLHDILENDTTDKTCKNCITNLLDNYGMLIADVEDRSKENSLSTDNNSEEPPVGAAGENQPNLSYVDHRGEYEDGNHTKGDETNSSTSGSSDLGISTVNLSSNSTTLKRTRSREHIAEND